MVVFWCLTVDGHSVLFFLMGSVFRLLSEEEGFLKVEEFLSVISRFSLNQQK